MAYSTAAFAVSLLLCFAGCAQSKYYGKLLSSSWGSRPAHELAGSVYAVDNNTFQIIGFTYDGNAPDAFFYLGTDKTYAQAAPAKTDPTAAIIQYPQGKNDVLKAHNNETIVVNLPSGKVLTDYTYISIWCRQFTVYFGGFDIPSGFVAPKPQSLGRLSQLAHGVSSGEVTVLDDKTIQIKNLMYDGQGPDAYFYVGVTDSVQHQNAPYGKIPDENGNSGILGAYSGKDVLLTLPGSLSFTQLKWLSLWCVQAVSNFGHVNIPANLNVPPKVALDSKNMNCEPLDDNLQISWLVQNGYITFELAGNIDRNADYMAFGLSGSTTNFLMIGADVVVADWKSTEPRAVDYHLTAYSQCAANGGACPDTSSSNNGVNNIEVLGAKVTDGILRISYRRPLNTGDSVNDKVYLTNGTLQQIAWAIGPLNNKNEAAKHVNTEGATPTSKINFGRTVFNNCPAFKKKAAAKKPDFKPHHLYGKPGTVFTMEIGQSGSTQGYKALTGNPSWGIAWYVNGILIPELYLKRGVSYTFRVAGGKDPRVPAKYHPLYFTSDPLGGFDQNKNSTETIFAGKVNGASKNFAVGGYCEWKLTAAAVKAIGEGKVSQCFEEFKSGLALSCDASPPGYTEFVFTPDASTPKTIYYQCYTHKSLGWKIHVSDELPTTEIATESCISGASAASALTFTMLTFLVTYLITQI